MKLRKMLPIIIMCIPMYGYPATLLPAAAVYGDAEQSYIVTVILSNHQDKKDIKFMSAIEGARSEAEAIGLTFTRARTFYADFSIVEVIATPIQYEVHNQKHSQWPVGKTNTP